MNVVARMTTAALREHGMPDLPAYRRALVQACGAAPPPFGKRAYAELYRKSARDPNWVALSLATNAQSEGDGAQHLWDMAASTPDSRLADEIRAHAIDEARHSRAYVTLIGLIFGLDEGLRAKLQALSPGYTMAMPLVAQPGSPYAYAATVDELIQMNIAEIRTRIHHLLQRPVLLALCKPQARTRVRRILDSLLRDETRHIAYTARLIERSAAADGPDHVLELMNARVRDFNEVTENEVALRTLGSA